MAVFQYNAQFHNVMRVTHAMYKSCNASSPLATFTTGNDTINITNHDHHFFRDVPGHCEAGQKLDINVPKLVASAPSPSASLSQNPRVPPSANNDVPAPSNMAASLVPFKGAFLGVQWLNLAIFALVES